MKNTVKFLGIIVFAAVIGFSMTACGGEEDNRGLTITGLKNYNGKFVIAVENTFMDAEDDAESSGLVAAAKIDIKKETVTGGKISGGSVTLKVWTAEGDEDDPNIIEYRGNDKTSFIVVILKEAAINANTFAGIEDDPTGLLTLFEKIAGFGTVEVTFKDGTASGEFTEKSPFDFM